MNSDFPVQNQPYGVYPSGDHAPVLDDGVFAQPSLNAFLARGLDRWTDVRRRATELLTGEQHRHRSSRT